MRRQFVDDTRGTRTVITHVLALGISSVLIIALVTAAGTYLTNQKENAARQELETIGSRLANEVTQLDRLSNTGGTATMRASHPGRVSGTGYNVRVASGDTCDTPSFTTSRCLVLWSDELDIEQKVPLNIDSSVEIAQSDKGEFRLSATATGPGETRRADVVEMPMRVGVGRDVRPDSFGRAINPSNEPPTAQFSFDPGSPDSATEITFNASASTDVDGEIAEYRWDVDQSTPGPEAITNTPTYTRTLSTPGYRNVTLTAVDDDDAKGSLIEFISVPGLAYNRDMRTAGPSDTVEFSLDNEWPGEAVRITSLRIDPADDSIDSLDEVVIDGDSYDVSSNTLHDGGMIVDAPYDSVGAGDTVTIELRGFEDGWSSADMDGKAIQVAVRHDVTSEQTNTTMFTDTVNGVTVSSYGLTATGSGVDLSFEASEQLDSIEVDLRADADGQYGDLSDTDDLTTADFTETALAGGSYRYETTVTGNTDAATYNAELTTAENAAGESAAPLPSDSITVTDAITWESEDDWDDVADQRGIVHASFGDRQADRLELGYSTNEAGLLTYYPFDEAGTTAPDASGNGHDGYSHYAQLEDEGIFDDSRGFDGDEDYVIDGDAESYLAGNDALTIAAWVQADSIDTDMGIIEGETPDGRDDSISLRHDDEGATAGCDECFKAGVTTSDDGETNIETTSDTQTTDWQHVAFTWDGTSGDLVLYHDGSATPLSATATGTGVLQDIEMLLVGMGSKGNPSSWNGNIDEVRVYDRALSGSEVEELYDVHDQREGSLTTEWEVMGTQNPSALNYELDVAPGSKVTVTVQADTDNDGSPDGSEQVALPHGRTGTGSASVGSSLPDANRYRLVVTLEGNGAGSDGPTVEKLELTP